MPIKRDASGKFSTGSGSKPSRAKKIAKVQGHKKKVMDNKNRMHNLAEVRRKAEKDDNLAWRKGDKAAMAKTEKHLAKVGKDGAKLATQANKLQQRSKTGGAKVHEFTAGAVRKKKLAAVAKRKGK
jgi:hypothetical protein